MLVDLFRPAVYMVRVTISSSQWSWSCFAVTPLLWEHTGILPYDASLQNWEHTKYACFPWQRATVVGLSFAFVSLNPLKTQRFS